MKNEHENNGSYVIDVRCDFPNCHNQDSVFSKTRKIALDILVKRGWEFDVQGYCYCQEHNVTARETGA